MTLPGFTAPAALYHSTATYRQPRTSPAPTGLRPAGDPCTVECTQPWDVPEYHPDPYSCHSFYQCANGVPVLHPCPGGLVFDPHVQPGPVCVWPEDYNCKPSCA